MQAEQESTVYKQRRQVTNSLETIHSASGLYITHSLLLTPASYVTVLHDQAQ